MKVKTEDCQENVFCNKCGMSCLNEQGSNNGLIEAEIIGGYDSTHIDDGDVYIFSLCEACLREIFKAFKLNARQGNIYSPDDGINGFDRRKYFGPDVKLWEDFSEDDIKELKEWSSSLDWIKDCPRAELIVWLYDLEQKETLSEKEEKCVQEIKKIMKFRDSKYE